MNLNGSWNYKTDAAGILMYRDVLALYKEGKIRKKMEIPNNWQLAGLNNFNGSVWFAKSFRFSKKVSKTFPIILHFKGVDYFTIVWLNGKRIGSHEGYFQPFHFDITDKVYFEKENELIVKVTSPFEESGKSWPYKKKLIKGIFNHHDCRPGGWDSKQGQDQNTGGIWNDVFISFNKKVFVENTKIISQINFNKNSARVVATIFYYNRFKLGSYEDFKIQITTPAGKTIVKNFKKLVKPGNGKVTFTLDIKNPKLWWSWDLGRQNLYTFSCNSSTLILKNIEFGIREVKLDDKSNFYINNKRLYLRGSNIIPTQFLKDLTKQKIKKFAKQIKQANINIVRVHAHVNRKEIYEEFDKLGILVWQDFALQWTYNNSERFRDNAVSQIRNMVKHLCNHPSIAFWCCHNEPGEQIHTLDTHLYEAVQSEDNSRIIRKASNYEEHAYDGWYWGVKEHYAAIPMGPLVTEFGAQAMPHLSSLKKFIPKKKMISPDWNYWKYHNFQYEQTFLIAEVDKGKSINQFINNSQNYQSDVIQTATDFYRRAKNNSITGIFQFMFVDCWPSITWSVVDYFGKPKKGYYTLQKVFQPLYVSVKLRQKKYFAGANLNIELWLINDLHKLFRNSRIEFRIGKKLLGVLKTGYVNKDSLMHFNSEGININLPNRIKIGKHTVFAELKNNQGVLSSNRFELEIVKKEKL